MLWKVYEMRKTKKRKAFFDQPIGCPESKLKFRKQKLPHYFSRIFFVNVRKWEILIYKNQKKNQGVHLPLLVSNYKIFVESRTNARKNKSGGTKHSQIGLLFVSIPIIRRL